MTWPSRCDLNLAISNDTTAFGLAKLRMRAAEEAIADAFVSNRGLGNGGVCRCLAIDVRRIADQAARSGEFTPRIDRRNGRARCQRPELLAPAGQERIRADDERA